MTKADFALAEFGYKYHTSLAFECNPIPHNSVPCINTAGSIKRNLVKRWVKFDRGNSGLPWRFNDS